MHHNCDFHKGLNAIWANKLSHKCHVTNHCWSTSKWHQDNTDWLMEPQPLPKDASEWWYFQTGYLNTLPTYHWLDKHVVSPQTHTTGWASVTVLGWLRCSHSWKACIDTISVLSNGVCCQTILFFLASADSKCLSSLINEKPLNADQQEKIHTALYIAGLPRKTMHSTHIIQTHS